MHEKYMPELKEKRNIVLYIWLIKYWMHLPKRQIDISYFSEDCPTKKA